MTYILTTNKLTKCINGKEIVSDLDMHIEKGEIYGFLGPNGAGKSTTMKMIANLWKPTSGRIDIFGEELTSSSYELLKRMGTMIELPSFYTELSGRKNLEIHAEYLGYYSKDSIKKTLKLFNLPYDDDKPVKDYSLGMKQRLGIARAILSKPELLILDEPINGLDPAGIKEIRDLLKMLCSEYGITILISSHILSEIENMADRVGIINHGKMIKEVSMKDISDGNLAYIELAVSNPERAAYILTDKLKINNFKFMSDNVIRIYENDIMPKDISRELALSNVEIDSITKKNETLEEYFLKLVEEGK